MTTDTARPSTDNAQSTDTAQGADNATGPDGAPSAHSATAFHRSCSIAGLRWMVRNNQTVFDRVETLPGELARADDQIIRLVAILAALRGTWMWRLLQLTHRVKQRLQGSAAGEGVDHWIDEVLALRQVPGPPPSLVGLEQGRGYSEWIRCMEATLLTNLAGGADADRVALPALPIVVVASGSALAAALQGIQAAHVGVMAAHDRMAPLALDIARAALAADPTLDILYADADRLDDDGTRVDPDLRPDWDPDLHLARDLLGGFTVYRTVLLRAALRGVAMTEGDLDGPAWAYALSLRVAARAEAARIRHIPAVLCHRAPPAPDLGAAQRAVVARTHAVLPIEGVALAWRVRPALPHPAPLVSLLIPTRDQPDLLSACLDGILHATAYPSLEVILIDNGTTDARALAVIAQAQQDARVRVIPAPGPFNWSRLNNMGAEAAHGAVLVLLNNDTVVIDPHWLTELAAQAMRPEVGAVGARLLYPDGRLQHAGIYIDDAGGTKHLYRFRKPGDPGPFNALAVVHAVTAVTGACLALRRDLYLDVDGPAESLAVASNDVDLCLRLSARGYRILWTPYAVLEHRELATRGADTTPEMEARAAHELRQLRRDWGGALAREPHLNANLVILDEEIRLRALIAPS